MALGRIAGRYYEMIGLLLTLVVLLTIPLKIMSYGYRPQDDANRHSAHALDERSWDEIVVQREGAACDTSPGWDVVLRTLHRGLGWDQEQLLLFSMVGLCWLFFLTGLVVVKNPLGWVCGLVATVAAASSLIVRITIGRPYIVTICCMMGIMSMWRGDVKGRRALRIFGTLLLFAIIAWVHGSWYLALLIPAAFLLSGQFSVGIVVGVCWLGGSLLGAAWTGHPLAFISQQVIHAALALGADVSQRYLVGEFRASQLDFQFFGVVAGTLLVRMIVSKKTFRDLVIDPLFVLFLLGSMLGVFVRRFLLDWGMPAGLLWMALQWRALIQEARLQHRYPLFGLGILGVLLAMLFAMTTSDYSRRWTDMLDDEAIHADDPELSEWLPEPGGIVYSDTMRVFYRTYFNNPSAPWRYMLGYEAGLMPEEDLKIYRSMQWNGFVPATFAPWVEKMRSEDRMIVLRKGTPAILGLEWHLAANNVWIGRKADGAESDLVETVSGD